MEWERSVGDSWARRDRKALNILKVGGDPRVVPENQRKIVGESHYQGALAIIAGPPTAGLGALRPLDSGAVGHSHSTVTYLHPTRLALLGELVNTAYRTSDDVGPSVTIHRASVGRSHASPLRRSRSYLAWRSLLGAVEEGAFSLSRTNRVERHSAAPNVCRSESLRRIGDLSRSTVLSTAHRGLQSARRGWGRAA
jgi:hypothetical protein